MLSYTIECLCVACHGPLQLSGRRRTPIVHYNEWCRKAYYAMVRTGKVRPRLQDARMLHAYRREMMATVAKLEEFLNAYQPL